MYMKSVFFFHLSLIILKTEIISIHHKIYFCQTKLNVVCNINTQLLVLAQWLNNVLKYWDTLKNVDFKFETNGKLMILGVPILRTIRLYCAKILEHLEIVNFPFEANGKLMI